MSKNQFQWFEIRHHSKRPRCEGISPFVLHPSEKEFQHSLLVVCLLCALCIPTCKFKRKFPLQRWMCSDVTWIHTKNHVCAIWSWRGCCHIISLFFSLRDSFLEHLKLMLKENRRKTITLVGHHFQYERKILSEIFLISFWRWKFFSSKSSKFRSHFEFRLNTIDALSLTWALNRQGWKLVNSCCVLVW